MQRVQELEELHRKHLLEQDRLVQLLRAQNQSLLLEALRPVAAAMLRQDSLQTQQFLELRELLLEILQGQVTPVSQQLGLSMPAKSSQHSAISALR